MSLHEGASTSGTAIARLGQTSLASNAGVTKVTVAERGRDGSDSNPQ